MKKIYTPGPMTGHPDLNFPAFHAELNPPGWSVSSGARLEIHIAHRVGIRVVEISLISEPMQVAA